MIQNSNIEIEKLVAGCLQKYFNEMGMKKLDDLIININNIFESVIYPEYEISLRTDLDLGAYQQRKVLGKTIPDEKLILIDKSIAPNTKDPRFIFTFGHEIGHGIFHTQRHHFFRCTEDTIFNEKDLFEKQANLFAKRLLMPAGLVKFRYEQFFDTNRPFRYIGAGAYNLNRRTFNIKSFLHLCKKVAEPLTPYFSHISKESLAYMLYELGIVRNITSEPIKGMNQFIEERFSISNILRCMPSV